MVAAPFVDEPFNALVRQLLQSLDVWVVAEACEASPATIRRWASGQNRPMAPLARVLTPILEALK